MEAAAPRLPRRKSAATGLCGPIPRLTEIASRFRQAVVNCSSREERRRRDRATHPALSEREKGADEGVRSRPPSQGPGQGHQPNPLEEVRPSTLGSAKPQVCCRTQATGHGESLPPRPALPLRQALPDQPNACASRINEASSHLWAARQGARDRSAGSYSE